MTRIRFVILFYFISICFCNAQSRIVEYEWFDSLETAFFIDGLTHNIRSDIVDSVYYHKLTSSDYTVRQVINEVDNNRQVFVDSRKAKKGFLYVNKSIMAYVSRFSQNSEPLKIVYVYNDKTITTEGDVMRIIRLRRRDIKGISVDNNKQSGTVTVYITGKR